MNLQLAALALLALVVAGSAATLSLNRRARSRARLWDDAEPTVVRRAPGRLARWLLLAGYRGPDAAPRFLIITICCLGVGIALKIVVGASPQLMTAAFDVSGLPVVGPAFARLVLVLPWAAALFVAAFPILLVRARRDRRVVAVEEDLPLVLELLATLAEGGLGFDASLDRLIGSQPAGRQLIDELRLYQLEVRGGGPRSECLSRMAARLQVPAVNSAVAAMIQAEEMGSGLATVLRPLADDLRVRRRERALAKAEALPEKLVFPLVLGFLPALLVWTLGPSFHQLITTIDAIMRGGS